jgi:hypothetical protein
MDLDQNVARWTIRSGTPVRSRFSEETQAWYSERRDVTELWRSLAVKLSEQNYCAAVSCSSGSKARSTVLSREARERHTHTRYRDL